MTPPRRGPAVLFLFVLCAGLATACGKKGPPLPPLARIPAAPASPQVARVGDDVYIWFTVPSANVSGQTPADISSVDVYAVTSEAPPRGPDLTAAAVRIGSYPVHVPLPAPPPVPEGAPPLPTPPALPGFVQGATAVVRETLSAEAREPTVLPAATTERAMADAVAEEALPGPLVAPPANTLKRHYFLVGVGPRARTSAPTAVLSVPVGDATDPPTKVTIAYTETSMTVSWVPSATSRPAPPPVVDGGDVLPSRPIVPPPPPTRYHVFAVPRDPQPAPDRYSEQLPRPLTEQPLSATTHEMPGRVAFGEERCFVVRPADLLAGTLVVGQPSAPACVTPVDTFPPAAPRQLAAIAGTGVINLIWEANDEPDLAGYIVLRGAAPDGPLQALTPSPIRETTYRDSTATAGVRYVYAVVAVDTAASPNVSAQSNRVEEESRTP